MVATVPQQHSTAVLSAPYIAKHHTYRPCSPNRPSWFLGSHAPLLPRRREGESSARSLPFPKGYIWFFGLLGGGPPLYRLLPRGGEGESSARSPPFPKGCICFFGLSAGSLRCIGYLSCPSRVHLFWRNHQPTTLIFNKDPHHHHHHHNTTEEEEDRADNTPSPPPLAALFVVGRRRPLHPRCMLLSATCSALKCFATLWQLYITVLRGVHSSKY